MLKTLQPDEMNVNVSVPPGAAKRISPKALTAALGRAKRGHGNGSVPTTCVVCGGEFVGRSITHLYCSDKCRRKAEREIDKARRAQHDAEHRRIVAALAEQARRPRTSAHWHFKVAADGRPTCLVPTLNKPKGRHVTVPVCGHETALEAMDRCVTGWGDKDAPSRKLQWRDE